MENNQLWYKNAVFYEVYIRAYYDSDGDGNGDIRGLIQKLDYLQELGVDCIWLLPIFPSPLNDDGYDIADYYGVLPEYGSLDDFKDLIDAAHVRNMRVITDLVINHTSDQHPWFQEARADRNSPYRDYYVWSDTDKKYPDARIIFLDTETSNWTWDEAAGQFYWHRFYSSQPDLNFDNPAVQQEMLNIVRFWLDLGVDGFRTDAVPYLFERAGTNCENLPETHTFIKTLRKFIDDQYPGRLLLCEANQWPEDVRPYFGDGDEFQMGFHFPLMPRIFMALHKQDVSPLRWILERTPEIPENCQWCTFLRNHDELTLEMVTEGERQWMWHAYAPEPRMRLNLGIRRRLAPLLENDRLRIELINSLLFTLPGSPIIYYGDEIGMGDNIWLPDRSGVRTPMQWTDGTNAGFSSAAPSSLYAPVIDDPIYSPEMVNIRSQKSAKDSLWSTIRKMISIRKEHLAFGWGNLAWADTGTNAVPGYWRTYKDEKILVLNNLTSKSQQIEISLAPGGQSVPIELLTHTLPAQVNADKLYMQMNPYHYMWIKFST
ncbi:MAG: maltose alpha-D-glucosyltransferase [Chloroflexota bacterium]|nr:maltose alpha-D-glucosyltransferase [Chloroflexota bacterium]